jgi:Tol biopolymer transport system component
VAATITLVSRSTAGAQGTGGGSRTPATDAAGRFIAFESSMVNLVAGCGVTPPGDIFLRDTTAGVTICLSQTRGGTTPAISGDGSLVAFASDSPLLDSRCNNGQRHIFLVNTGTGVIVCVSVNTANVQANGSSYTPGISANGRFVAYSSDGDNLDSDCPNARRHVYRRDLVLGETECVSEGLLGPGNDDSGNAITSGGRGVVLSADGRYVVFESLATNLDRDGRCTNGFRHVHMRDTVALQTLCMDVSTAGIQGDADSAEGAYGVSGDGRWVVLESMAASLAPPCLDGQPHVYLRDVLLGTTVCVDQGSLASGGPAISGDGRFVVFRSGASNLAPPCAGGVSGLTHVFIVDLATGVFTCASTGATGTPGNGSSGEPVIDADGSRVTFVSVSTNLVPGGTNGSAHVFVADFPVSGARPTITAPASGAQIALGAPLATVFVWTAVGGAAQYFLEFTGPGQVFANPNGTAPDPVNGFGGTGGGVVVAGTSLSVALGLDFPTGTVQVRVAALSLAGQIIGGFGDAITIVVVPAGPPTDQPTVTAPVSGAQLARGQFVTVTWTVIPGAVLYGVEFTGANLVFANPNGTVADGVNGFGGAGGGLVVGGTTVSLFVPAGQPPGAYQVRVIALTVGLQPASRFSDAVTVVIQ